MSHADTVEHLRALVAAMDGAFISSWQTTHYWQRELDAAREHLAALDAREPQS